MEGKKTLVILRNWSSMADRREAAFNTLIGRPMSTPLVLHGNCYGHPKKGDGSEVTTSFIHATTGLFVETQNTIYYLDGEPDPGWLAYLEEIKWGELDRAWPIKKRSEGPDSPPVEIDAELLRAATEDLEETLNRMRTTLHDAEEAQA